MRWFKCLDPQSESMLAAEEALGEKGAWECLKAVSIAVGLNTHTLKVETVSKWASIKRDRAAKILPFAQKILDETWKIYRKSAKNSANVPQISENPEENSENLPDFDASNPHETGISYSHEEEEKEEENHEETDQFKDEERVTSAPALDEKFLQFGREGQQYLLSLGHPSLQNISWVTGYLAIGVQRLLDSRPDLTLEHIATCWRDTCDDATTKNIAAPKWFKTAFEGKVREFNPKAPPKGSAPVVTMQRWQVLIDSDKIQSIFDPLDVRRGRDYTHVSGHGVDAYLVCKHTGDKIRAGDYKPIK